MNERAAVLKLIRLRRDMATGHAQQLRASCGLSARRAARGAGVSPAAVIRWESLNRVPTGDAALRYADFLAVLEREALHVGGGAA